MLHEVGPGLAGGVAGLAGLLSLVRVRSRDTVAASDWPAHLGDGLPRRRGPRGLGRARGDLPQHRGVAVTSHLEEANYILLGIIKSLI